MNTLMYELPPMADWSKKTLAASGIPVDATYLYMFLINSAGTPLGHHVMSGRKATVIERMIAIKNKSGVTDTRLHQSVLDAKEMCGLVVIK
jgi:hypothetical protein